MFRVLRWGWYNTGSCCFGLMRVWFKLTFVVCRWWCLAWYVVLGWFWLGVLVFADTSVCCGRVVWGVVGAWFEACGFGGGFGVATFLICGCGCRFCCFVFGMSGDWLHVGGFWLVDNGFPCLWGWVGFWLGVLDVVLVVPDGLGISVFLCFLDSCDLA